MPKMIDGSIACRISYAPESSGRKYYCDHCGKTFDDREYLPCDEIKTEDFIFPKREDGKSTEVTELPVKTVEVGSVTVKPLRRK